MPKIDKAIDAGLRYLADQQQSDGSFDSFSSPSARPFKPVKTYHTTFAPALILSALSSSDTPASLAIRDQLARWLIDQASPHWSFNYWSTGSPERTRQPYPDDLDDTFCALSALYLHDPALIDGKVLAEAVKLLLATESTVGGPYRTWLADTKAGPAWQDVDVAVNANVAYFLSLTSDSLPNLTSFIDRAISHEELTSPYYPSVLLVIYYVARGYSGKHRQTLLNLLHKRMVATDSALDLALCLSSLSRLGGGGEQGDIDRLLAGQQPNGSWPAMAFCFDPAVDGQAYYSGSAALTTAFAVEALELWRTRTPEKLLPDASNQPTEATSVSRNDETMQLVQKQCQPLPKELRIATMRSLQTLASGSNGDEIVDLAPRFNNSLTTPLSASANQLLLKLSAANLYGWTAYTIYDDFLDGEGQPELLSVANVALRYSLANWLEALPGNKAFADVVTQTFDTIDGANAWELTNCRFTVTPGRIVIGELPDYGDLSKLAERSLGHNLGPIAILIRAGAALEGDSIQQLREAFKHYLIARQLNDDCHDWVDDLQNGHITYVVGRLLAELDVQTGRRVIAPLHARARQQFWHTTLPSLCQEMLEQVKLSRSATQAIKELKTSNILTDLLDNLETSITETTAEQERSVAFLKQYSKTAS